MGRRAVGLFFGDRRGVAVFLGAVLFVSLWWRIETTSNDTFTDLNTLLAVADGHFEVGADDLAFGPSSGDTPGMRALDGRRYGDSYGLVLLSLPMYLLLRVGEAVADVRLLLSAVWSLCLVGLAVVAGRKTDRAEAVTVLGAIAALVTFVGNAIVAGPLEGRWLPLLALQTTTLLAGALTGTFVYRLVGRATNARRGTIAGAAAVVATPVGFWAPVPKRHSVVALLALVTVYSFYRSREAASKPEPGWEPTLFRAAAYGTVGVTAWINAAEALVMFVALAGVDLPTTSDFRPKRLAAVAGVFILSLAPFALTNELVTGSFYEPARFLGQYRGEGLNPTPQSGGAEPSTESVQGGGTGGAESESGSSFVRSLLRALPVPTALLGIASRAFEYFGRNVVLSVDTLLTEPNEVFHAFVRSGYTGRISPGRGQAVNLSVVESMPLIGALVGSAATFGRNVLDRYRRKQSSPLQLRSPIGATSLLVVVYAALLVLFYLEYLWFHHMLTVRYLHPLYPLAIVLLAVAPPVGRVLEGRGRTAIGSYLLTVVVCSPLYVLAIVALDAVQGEAVQLYALVALAAGGGLAAWSTVVGLRADRRRTDAIWIGVAAGLTTTYILVVNVVVFSTSGRFLLPLVEVAAGALHGASPLP